MTATRFDHPDVLDLKPGDFVRVRSAEEIFSTLDEEGALDGLPFMPEMLEYCGRRLPVYKRADKTCAADGKVRRMYNTVHLSNVRCDGAAHGGCQAACLIFWKEAWLERVEHVAVPESSDRNGNGRPFVAETLIPATKGDDSSTADEPVYRCQATEIPHASSPLRLRYLDQYVRDVRSWGLLKVARGLVIEAFNQWQRVSRRALPHFLRLNGGRLYPSVDGRLDKAQVPTAKLDLRPGELVRIKSREEIVKTLDRSGRNKGLSFDPEMIRYCGRTARVRGRVERLIDERTGRMIRIGSDCIILDGVVCAADYHLFCTRSIYPYWREIWLERVDESSSPSGPSAPRNTRGRRCLGIGSCSLH